MIKTAYIGNNSELIPRIFSLYVPEQSVVADVTYGRGVFWKNINKDKYKVYFSDISIDGTDFRNLPCPDNKFDCLLLDPPYMHGGKTVKESLNRCYRNENTSHESIIRLYAGGLLEAHRVLKRLGVVIIKTQDEIESGKQKFSHIEVMDLMRLFGFELMDLFVLVQDHDPLIRQKVQHHARKNHSYGLVGRKK